MRQYWRSCARAAASGEYSGTERPNCCQHQKLLSGNGYPLLAPEYGTNATRDGMNANREGIREIWRRPVTGLLGCFLAAILALAPASALSQRVWPYTAYVAGSGNSVFDQHFRLALQDVLGHRVSVMPLPSRISDRLAGSPVVALGAPALTGLHRSGGAISVLAAFVERPFMQKYAENHKGRISAVYQDVPLIRQALIGQAILPQATRVALLATDESASVCNMLLDQLPSYGLEGRVFLVESEDELVPVLIQALAFGDFIVATPDQAIYNSRTIKHILLTAYRHNRIVIGPSQAYVKAGSLASGYATFPATVRMVASYLETYFATGEFPAPGYPDEYLVAVNRQVARSLDIPLPGNPQIRDLVEAAMEAGTGPVP